MKKVILFLLMCVSVYAQVIPIDSLRRQDANGVPFLLGQTVTVRGVVTMSQELGTPLVYLQDPTGGTIGYDGTFWSNTNAGDSVQVTGVVTQYNGLTEFTPVNSSTVLATNIPFTPRVVTCGNVRLDGETYEAQLIRINGVTAVHNTSGANVTQWSTSGSGTNYRILVGNDSVEIRIYSSTNIANSPIPPFPFDVIALVSQFDSSPPYTSGYQILPRSLNDFIVTGGSGPLLSSITYTNIQPTSVTINWQSSTASDSKVRWQRADSNYQVISYTDSASDGANVTTHSVTLNGLQPGRIYYYNVSSTDGSGTGTSPQQYFCTGSNSTGAMNVYFNRSVDTLLSTGENAQGNVNFQTKLLQRINAAQYSIDMALYSFNDMTQIRDAIINAKLRGVKIRLVYDFRENGSNQQLVQDLLAAGILMSKRPNADYMNNKFFIFDNRDFSSAADDWLWTGSTNITQAQLFDDANNVIEIQDQTLATIYTREFEEMWGSANEVPIPSRAKFGPQKTDNTPHLLNIAGKRVEVYFSPSDNPSTRIEDVINTQTDNSILFCILSYTRCNIMNRMKVKYDAGKNVRGVFDDGENSSTSSVYKTMKGLTGGGCSNPLWSPPADVWLDSRAGQLHHKYIIVDGYTPESNPVTITGSYNFSNNATFDNDENFLVVYDARVANLYLQEFSIRYRDGGGTNPIGITQLSNEIPSEFRLFQNYPNPFNPSSTIKYQVAKSGLIKLTVYDALGREVKSLVNKLQGEGTYSVEFEGTELTSGIYFYTLEADGMRVDSKKMVLVK